MFGFFIGATTILGCLLGFCRSHLPSQRIKELEELLGETQLLYESAVEDGLLPDGMLRSQMGERLAVYIQSLWQRIASDGILSSLREATLTLRSRAYSATTWLKEYQEFFRGLSYSIGVACCDVKEIRASVIVSFFKLTYRKIFTLSRKTTTEAERRRTGVCGGDCSGIGQSASPALPQASCIVGIRPVPRPQTDLLDHLHAASMTHAAHSHVVEVDLTELSDFRTCDFLGSKNLA